MKIKLIPDWKKAYQYITVQLAGLMFLLSYAYDYLPAFQMYMPAEWVKLFALVIIGARIIKQKNIKEVKNV